MSTNKKRGGLVCRPGVKGKCLKKNSPQKFWAMPPPIGFPLSGDSYPPDKFSKNVSGNRRRQIAQERVTGLRMAPTSLALDRFSGSTITDRNMLKKARPFDGEKKPRRLTDPVAQEVLPLLIDF